MEEVPLSAGLQIIDAENLSKGISRQRITEAHTDSEDLERQFKAAL